MKTKEKRKRKRKSSFSVVNENIKKPIPDRMKFFGTVKMKIDPVVYQRQIRDEWD